MVSIRRPLLTKQSKFSTIVYPAAGLYKVPKYKITGNSIEVQKANDQVEVVDLFGPTPFLDRYIRSNSTFFFDATVLNISQLITSKVVWLVDKEAKIHNLTKKERFEAKSLKITRAGAGVCWVTGISYPFEIRAKLINYRLLLSQYATVVKIDRQWVLYEFTAFKQSLEYLRL